MSDCLKQLRFSLGWLNSPRCWLAPLCKVGRPTRRLGDKERALPCCRGVPLTSSVDFTQRAPAPLLTSDVGNTRCVGQPSLLWWGCNCTNHIHVGLPTGLSDLGDNGSGLDEHQSKTSIELSLKQGWEGPGLEKELIENALNCHRAADVSFLWRVDTREGRESPNSVVGCKWRSVLWVVGPFQQLKIWIQRILGHHFVAFTWGSP